VFVPGQLVEKSKKKKKKKKIKKSGNKLDTRRKNEQIF